MVTGMSEMESVLCWKRMRISMDLLDYMGDAISKAYTRRGRIKTSTNSLFKAFKGHEGAEGMVATLNILAED